MADAPLIAGVLGWPVSHSLSPKLHNHWLKKLGIDGEYKALAVEPKDLEKTLKSLPEMGWRGCNLTIPHKEAAIPFLDDIDDIARTVGAVNTVIVNKGKLYGTNTDVYGFAENIRPYILTKRRAVVLGAGGAAKAVWKALWDEGFEEIIVTNRTPEKLPQAEGRFIIKPWDERSNILEGADLLVNTTSLGMTGKDKLDIDLAGLPTTALVTDIVYTPLMTPLLEAAKARGNPVVDGLGMLIWQAVPGFVAWFGKKPVVSKELQAFLIPSPLVGDG